jgi:putative transposase
MAGNRWTGTQKKALAEEQTVVFVDETGFYLLPAVGRTYAPMGQTPILRETLTRDHRSLIGALTLDGRVFVQGQDRSLCSTDVVRFLKHLLRHIEGKVRVVWDGASIHYGAVKEFLRRGAAARITLVRLPSYAPELNPVEGLWRYVKHVELRNVCCHTLTELRQEVRNAVARVRHRGDVLAGCVRQPGCY